MLGMDTLQSLVQKNAPVWACILHTQAADHPSAATNGAAGRLLDPDLVEAGTLHAQPTGSIRPGLDLP